MGEKYGVGLGVTIYLEKDGQNLYEQMQSYFEKVRNSEIFYCEAHDLEYVKEDGCYACRDECEDVSRTHNIKTKSKGVQK